MTKERQLLIMVVVLSLMCTTMMWELSTAQRRIEKSIETLNRATEVMEGAAKTLTDFNSRVARNQATTVQNGQRKR